MPADQLCRDRLDHVAECKALFLIRHLRVEDDLQEEIAQLVLQVIEIAALDRVGNLVGFLDRVRSDRGEILREVPRAANLGRPEPRHDRDQVADILAGLHSSADGFGMARSIWPRSRSGSTRSRTSCFSAFTSGKPPSRFRSQMS